MRTKNRRKSAICFNCDQQLINQENFCPKCGQENHSKQASTATLVGDFLNDFIAYDSKLFRSVIPLFTSPGKVTSDYLSGKRQRYIPPFRVFLFLSFVYFGLSLLLGEPTEYFRADIDESNVITDNSKRINQLFAENFKLGILIFTPVQAWIFMLFFRSKEKKFFVNFMVYTLHLFSFFFLLGILFTLIFYPIRSLNVSESAIAILKIVPFLYIIYYLYVSLKRVFQKPYTWLRMIGTGFLSLLSFMVFMVAGILLIIFVVSGGSL